jgi:CRP-like cAMP-binding protein
MSAYNPIEMRKWFQQEEICKKSLVKDEVLYHQGDDVVAVYFVEKGEVLAERYLPNGQTISLFRAQETEALSEEILFFPTQLYSAVATGPTDLRLISKNTILSRMEEQPQLRKVLTECLAKRYVESFMYREILNIRSADERVLCWIRWRLEGEVTEIDLSGRVGTIGSELGLAKESVYRALASLEKKGQIRRDGGILTLPLN